MVRLGWACQCLVLVLPLVFSSVVPGKIPVQGVLPKGPAGETLPKQAVETILYTDEQEKRMVEVVYEIPPSGKSRMADCFIMGDKLVSKEFLATFPPDRAVVLSKGDLNNLLNECSAFLLSNLKEGKLHSFTDGTRASLGRGVFDSLLIFPGTKWCGAGNVASDYEDLGSADETDVCCRDHDHCFDSIPAGETKYDLKNKAIYTKSHCDCDKNFYSCLRNNDVSVSNTVGGLYFNTLQVQCFEQNFPIVKCLKYSGWLPWIYWSCQQYQLDTTKPKLWQFFDAKKY